MSTHKRKYRMKARAEAAAETGRDILQAAVSLWHEQGLDEITLQAIADRAGVSVQTVIRRFGSREGVIRACIESDAAGARKHRGQAVPGDFNSALDILLTHYERDGDAVMRTLALEEKMEAARVITDRGRAEHRSWCARVFGPFLPPGTSEDYPTRLDAFVAATDFYLWKLLRRDLRRTPEQTRNTIKILLECLVLHSRNHES